MTKSELQKLVNPVRRRHNRRLVCTLALMFLTFFGGLRIAPPLSGKTTGISHRDMFIYAVVAVYMTIAVVGFTIDFRRIKLDCYRFGAICPHCGATLYSRRRLLLGGFGTLETGRCPECRIQLVAGTSG